LMVEGVSSAAHVKSLVLEISIVFSPIVGEAIQLPKASGRWRKRHAFGSTSSIGNFHCRCQVRGLGGCNLFRGSIQHWKLLWRRTGGSARGTQEA
jgi:hypothetical protein